MRRRTVLSAVGATALLSSGCLASRENEPSAPSDRASLRRAELDAAESPWNGWRLETPAGSYRLGEEVVVTLSNTADRERYTGNKRMYRVFKRDAGAWVPVYDTPDRLAVTQEAIVYPPGDEVRWSLELTRDGITTPYEEFGVRQSLLGPGRYRFVYVGLDDDAVFTEFEMRE